MSVTSRKVNVSQTLNIMKVIDGSEANGRVRQEIEVHSSGATALLRSNEVEASGTWTDIENVKVSPVIGHSLGSDDSHNWDSATAQWQSSSTCFGGYLSVGTSPSQMPASSGTVILNSYAFFNEGPYTLLISFDGDTYYSIRLMAGGLYTGVIPDGTSVNVEWDEIYFKTASGTTNVRFQHTERD